jgi:hypothetical protein
MCRGSGILGMPHRVQCAVENIDHFWISTRRIKICACFAVTSLSREYTALVYNNDERRNT